MNPNQQASGLYAGVVRHARLRPRRHRLRYRIFMLLLDLDELDALDRRLKLFKVNRAGLLSFQERDHAGGSDRGLKAKIEDDLIAAGLPVGGPIRLLCMPRMLGFVFNPISVYFCHGPDGRLGAIRYEVNNTFGQRHSYLIAAPDQRQTHIEQGCDKQLFVSPFMHMDMTYRFQVDPPTDDVRLVVNGLDAQGLLITTSFSARRRALTDWAILKAIVAHPLMTVMVVAGIHWEALKLFLKGVKLVPRPPPPAEPVTVVL
ncbi:MAG TPA: DUF1365 family protein [Caulobacteraceae bacterium]|nr:DUF1365 family protein [Caulobacteraceae bacterium]